MGIVVPSSMAPINSIVFVGETDGKRMERLNRSVNWSTKVDQSKSLETEKHEMVVATLNFGISNTKKSRSQDESITSRRDLT